MSCPCHTEQDGTVAIEPFLPHMTRTTFRKGDELFRADDPATEMYYIESGVLELTEIGKVLGPGHIMGEMGLFCPTNMRTVSALCLEDLVVFRMSRDDVLSMMDSAPHDVLQLIRLAIARFSENLRRETAERERMESELRIAAEIQMSALPAVFPDHERVELFAVMEPAREVGGDFYDFFMVDDDTLFFAVGDVSGKGVPAALFMMTVKTYLRTEARRGPPPGQVLEAVNRLVYPDNSSMMFVTLLCGTMNLRSGEVQFGSAGHPPPLISVDGRVLDGRPFAGSSVIGFDETITATTGSVTLGPGGFVVLYSDGVTEACNGHDAFYSDERLVRVAQHLTAGSMKSVVGGILSDVISFTGKADRFDDITILAARFRGGMA